MITTSPMSERAQVPDRRRQRGTAMDGIANLQAAAKGARLVIFVGAGASMGPPTDPPSCCT